MEDSSAVFSHELAAVAVDPKTAMARGEAQTQASDHAGGTFPMMFTQRVIRSALE
jgi:hypothetical protein